MLTEPSLNFLLKLLLWILLFGGVYSDNRPFDPNDCYEPGTIFEENEKNLGFCPCKYGYYGPLCFDIFDCVIGELRTDNCSVEFKNDYDLQWRCAASKKEIVKICTCPEGFRGETCEFILENTFSTYWETVKQSQKFFEIVYNRSHSVVRLAGNTVFRKILEHRRFLMVVIFLLILEVAWRRSKRVKTRQQQFQPIPIPGQYPYSYPPLINHEIWKEMEAQEIPMKEKMEENKNLDRFRSNTKPETTIVQISEVTETTETTENSRVHRPCLHI